MVSSARVLSAPPALPTAPLPQPATGTSRLWLCAHFPALALEVLQIDPSRPAAAVEDRKGRPCLHTVAEAARPSGVDPGLPVAAALALCPGLLLRARDPVAERNTLHRLAEVGLNFTPWVSLDRPGSLLLEIRGSLNLFGGAERLRERLRQELLALGHRPVFAITPSAEASGLLARLGTERIVTDRTALRAVLGPLPAGALPLDEKTLRRLLRSGIRHLADLWRLPRAGLARRYGAAFLRQLDALAGGETQVLSAFHRPPRFAARRGMPLELERLEHVFPAIAQLADEFAAFLKARDAAALGMTLVLVHRGRSATRLELGFRSGNRDTGHWLSLWREKLERVSLPAPVIALELLSEAVVPFQPERAELFGDGRARFSAGRDWQAVLEQLQTRLGHPALRQLGTLDDHRPERAMGGDAGPPDRRPDLPARPLWLLSAPEPLDSRDIRLLSEPERIESGWWDGAPIRRDYRVALDRRGRKLWVFQDLNRSERWYLHGLFG